jgi:hypothetical protein
MASSQSELQRVGMVLLPLMLFACTKRDLRGQSTRSEDGRTYLVIAESPGCAAFHVDGRPWPHALGARGRSAPGLRRIACSDGSNEIVFELKQGTIFRFDYWGP